jgi:spermidine synthase
MQVKGNRLLKIIYLLFFLSGGTALIYEIIWIKEFTLIMGNTIYSSSMVLSAFMGGLALGSIVLGRFIDNTKRCPLKIYAVLELGIALFAFIFPYLLASLNPLYQWIYQTNSEHTVLITFSKFIISFFLLLIPTFLMGGTLPILSKYVISSFQHLGKRTGTLYAVNTLGAVIGSLLTGYLLIGLIGIRATTYTAIIINLFLFCFTYLLSFLAVNTFPNEAMVNAQNSHHDEFSKEHSRSSMILVLIVYGLSGFTALAYEIIWMRIFIPFLSSSIYSFTTMLVAFLLGLSLGSWMCSKFVDLEKKLLSSLGMMQILIGFFSVLSLIAFNVFYFLFSNELNSALENMNAWAFLVTIVFHFIILLPPSLLLGAVFPLVVKIYSDNKINLIGKTVGNIYFFNTVGAILGSLVTGFFLIGWLGVQGSFMLMVALNVVGGLLLIGYSIMGKREIRLVLACLLIVILTTGLSPYSKNIFKEILIDRLTHLKMIQDPADIVYYEEDTTANVCAISSSKGTKNLLINSIPATGVVLETKLMAHLPLLLHKSPQNALVICFGIGTTFSSAYLHGIDVKAVELVPNLIESFSLLNNDAQSILESPKTEIVINDGRNHLLLSQEKYDVITIDPSPPLYSSGTVNLYTEEFYQLCRQRLTDDGIVSMWLWVPSCRESEFKMLVKTFMSVFPNTTIWSGVYRFGIYLIGSNQEISIDLPALAKRIENPLIQNDLKKSLRHKTAIDSTFILSLFLFDKQTAWNIVKDAPLLTDDHPYTEYPLLTWWRDKKKIDISSIVERKSDVRKIIEGNR